MARVINQNNEVIATKNNNKNNGSKKANVSKTSFIVGVALAVAAIVIILVVILFVTTKEKKKDEKVKTPLLQYIENYTNTAKSNPKIKVLSSTYIEYEMKNFTGECYILIYDVDWMTKNDTTSDIYKSYDVLDSVLTGKPQIDGTEFKGEPLLKAIENCGQDVKFFVIDLNSIEKKDADKEKNPVYFTSHNGVSFQDLKSPMLFHYIDSETYDDMNDEDLLLANGETKRGTWKVVANKAVSYLNSLTTSTDK